jgi:hypothetical protein
VHEQDDRERARSRWQAQIADKSELTGLEDDHLDPGRLGLSCAGSQEQQGQRQ